MEFRGRMSITRDEADIARGGQLLHDGTVYAGKDRLSGMGDGRTEIGYTRAVRISAGMSNAMPFSVLNGASSRSAASRKQAN